MCFLQAAIDERLQMVKATKKLSEGHLSRDL